MENNNSCLSTIGVIIAVAVIVVGIIWYAVDANSARRLEAQATIAQAQAVEAQARVQWLTVAPLAFAARMDTLMTAVYSISDRAFIGILLVIIAALLFVRDAERRPRRAPRITAHPEVTHADDGETLGSFDLNPPSKEL